MDGERSGHRDLLAGSPAWTSRRLIWIASSVAVAAGVLAGSLLSPLALSALAAGYRANWSQLSAVGQTYDAASAVLSALALFGVSASLLFQARQVRSQRVQIVRDLHFELTKIALSDPELLLPCWRPIPVPTLDQKRQHIYENLVFSYFWTLSELTDLSEDQLRTIARGHFRGVVGRRYWEAVTEHGWMPTFAANSSRRRRRRFETILTEEFTAAVRGGGPVQPERFSAESANGRAPVDPPPSIEETTDPSDTRHPDTADSEP